MPTREQYDQVLAAIGLAVRAAQRDGIVSAAKALLRLYSDVCAERDALARPVS